MLTVSETHGSSGRHGAQTIWRWDDRYGVDLRISAIGEKLAEAARQVSGSRVGRAHGRD